MELKKIVNISGKAGLFQVVKPAKNAIIVESIDDQKSRFTVGTSAKVSVLQEVSIYTLNADGSTPLGDVLKNIYQEHPEGIQIDTKKATDQELRAFLATVVPDYHTIKVYPSDIKKLISWYNLLLKYAPEVFTEVAETAETAETTEVTEAQKEEVQA